MLEGYQQPSNLHQRLPRARLWRQHARLSAPARPRRRSEDGRVRPHAHVVRDAGVDVGEKVLALRVLALRRRNACLIVSGD